VSAVVFDIEQQIKYSSPDNTIGPLNVNSAGMLNLPSFLKQLGENFHTDLTTIHNQIIPINTLDYPFQNGVILNDSTVIASKLKNTVQQLHAGFPNKN